MKEWAISCGRRITKQKWQELSWPM
jgi:hypothetical protein